MTELAQATRHQLARRELVSVDGPGERVFRCESGELWITSAGPEDIILEAGESFRSDGSAPVVVSALRTSTLVVECLSASAGEPGSVQCGWPSCRPPSPAYRWR